MTFCVYIIIKNTTIKFYCKFENAIMLQICTFSFALVLDMGGSCRPPSKQLAVVIESVILFSLPHIYRHVVMRTFTLST